MVTSHIPSPGVCPGLVHSLETALRYTDGSKPFAIRKYYETKAKNNDVQLIPLLNAQHFAEVEAWGPHVNLYAPVAYERRSTCKLKHSPSVRIAGDDTPTRSSQRRG
jgi:hypothetical protein